MCNLGLARVKGAPIRLFGLRAMLIGKTSPLFPARLSLLSLLFVC